MWCYCPLPPRPPHYAYSPFPVGRSAIAGTVVSAPPGLCGFFFRRCIPVSWSLFSSRFRWLIGGVAILLWMGLSVLTMRGQALRDCGFRPDTEELTNRPQVQERETVSDREATLAGVITDPSGAVVPGATVVLQGIESGLVWSTVSGQQGGFEFAGLLRGNYKISVKAAGFQGAVASAELTAGERRELEPIVVALPAGHADAYVTADQRDLAGDELHAAEGQRIAGFPDFYTSFVWNAAPLDARQKLSLGVRATTDRMAFVTAGLVASGEQIRGTFPGYGGGVGGFGKRYGAAYADGFTGKFVGGALLPSIFRQDPRYFYMGPSGTLKQRVWHAVASAFVTRGDNGRTEPNYSHILGNASSGALSSLYHPAADSAGKLALDNALLGSLGEAGVNVVRELFLKRFVRGGDVDVKGMPPSTPHP